MFQQRLDRFRAYPLFSNHLYLPQWDSVSLGFLFLILWIVICGFSLWVNRGVFLFCELSTFLYNHRHPLLIGFMTITTLAFRLKKKKELNLLFPSHPWLPHGTSIRWKGTKDHFRHALGAHTFPQGPAFLWRHLGSGHPSERAHYSSALLLGLLCHCWERPASRQGRGTALSTAALGEVCSAA